MTLKELLEHGASFRYQMLSRMQMDCNYFLGYGNRNVKKLWALHIGEHITYMRELWGSFPKDAKPEWLTLQEINNFEIEMIKGTELKKWRVDWYGEVQGQNLMKRIYLYATTNEEARKIAESFEISDWIEILAVAN